MQAGGTSQHVASVCAGPSCRMRRYAPGRAVRQIARACRRQCPPIDVAGNCKKFKAVVALAQVRHALVKRDSRLAYRTLIDLGVIVPAKSRMARSSGVDERFDLARKGGANV